MDDLLTDTRLHDKSIRDGKLTRAELEKHLAALPDVGDKMVTFDDEGNPTNIPQRKLKELAIKPGAPEPIINTVITPADPLADAWDELPGSR